MDKSTHAVLSQATYVFKVVLGVVLLALLVLAALWLPLAPLSPIQQQFGLGILLLAALALIPLVNFVYRRQDELQRLLHKRASVNTLSVVISLSCLLGILQASAIVPLFNQFWTLGVVIAVWGLNLMLADRRYK